MGLALALGAVRLLRGGIAAAAEDRDRGRLDTFAALIITVGLFWMNFRRHFARVLNRSASSDESTPPGRQGLPCRPGLHLRRIGTIGPLRAAPKSARILPMAATPADPAIDPARVGG